VRQAPKRRPGLNVTTVKPPDYKAGHYDLYVFDGWLPPGPLPQPSLLVNPPQGQEPIPTGQQINPGAVLPGNPREPLLQDVSMADVHVQSAASVKPTQDWRTIIGAASGPLLQTAQTGVYSVRQTLASGTRLSRFVVELHDQAVSRIQPGAAPPTQAVDQPRGPLPRGTLEIWPWLAGIGLGLLALEWVLY